jgi:ubiquinone biosynthesis protein
MIVAALIGDSDAALEAAAALSFDIEEIQPEHLRSLILSIMGDSTGADDLATVLSATRIRRIPGDFGLVLRTMLLLNGLSHRLAPGRRLIQGELLKHLAAGATRSLEAQANQEFGGRRVGRGVDGCDDAAAARGEVGTVVG